MFGEVNGGTVAGPTFFCSFWDSRAALLQSGAQAPRLHLLAYGQGQKKTSSKPSDTSPLHHDLFQICQGAWAFGLINWRDKW